MNLQAYILQLRIKVAELMLQILRLQTGAVKNPDKRSALYEAAMACIGKDVAPRENEFGCAEAVNYIFKKTFGREVGGDLSTYRMYHVLRSDPMFQRVLETLAGDIVISPTGYGKGTIKNGHVGIVGEGGVIMSNDSITGLWTTNFTIESWRKKYVEVGGFPMVYYRVV